MAKLKTLEALPNVSWCLVLFTDVFVLSFSDGYEGGTSFKRHNHKYGGKKDYLSFHSTIHTSCANHSVDIPEEGCFREH